MTVRVFMPDCFTHFTISGTKYFHKAVSQHMQGVVGSVIYNHFIANFLQNLLLKNFKDQLRFDRVTAMNLVSPFLGGHGVLIK